jgi:hypothetical protein
MSALVPGGEKERDFSWLDWSLVRDLSPDGHDLALRRERRRGKGPATPRTSAGPTARRPFASVPKCSQSLRRRAARAGDRRGGHESTDSALYPIGTASRRMFPRTRAPHGPRPTFFDGARQDPVLRQRAGSRHTTLVQGVDDTKPRAISPEGYRFAGRGRLPDGKLATVTGPDQAPSTCIPVEGGEPTPIPGMVTGDIPSSWSPDGRGLLVRRRGEVPHAHHGPRTRGVREKRSCLEKSSIPPDPAGVTVGEPVLRHEERNRPTGSSMSIPTTPETWPTSNGRRRPSSCLRRSLYKIRATQ